LLSGTADVGVLVGVGDVGGVVPDEVGGRVENGVAF
jgi:hypothetical protein